MFAAFVLGADRVVAHPLQGGALLAGSVASLVLLVRRELPKAAPLIPLDLLRVHSFRISVIASVCCFTGQMAALVALPFYIQHELGQSTVTAGLLMTPWPLAVMLAAPLSARLAQRLPSAWLCAAGSACFSAGLALCALWPLNGDSALPIALFTSLAGLGFGFFQTPNNQNMLLSAPKEPDVRAAVFAQRGALGAGDSGGGRAGRERGEPAQAPGNQGIYGYMIPRMVLIACSFCIQITHSKDGAEFASKRVPIPTYSHEERP
jgi:predicted MFS family arabinose efflux permease